ncbi:unnamed protein product [Hermetia illucens]|uniref:PH domain-containing protein n=1 Tax=Hermetia illucens TaxID=343691 RepID=A0A7R8UXV3_HERIL|nr:differentially expressed in FDCP 6-like [Hermetia illucens]XP_037916570.1 differentially expressed in FDCP 6-like [Hermetia illucens]XP_037916571.1 differentially expressed in FDCP 6-like [Hermetia illucens]CAD7087954.1 unnamed protein product [Hermetia illucens]
MAGLLRNVTNAIWHAFNALHQEERGLVNKTKLKVLTANIATVLDLYGLEKGLDHYRSSMNLSFEHFHHYLRQEVFSSLPNSLSMAEMRNFEEKIEEICWLICRRKYAEANHTSLDEKHLYKLFRIFCLVSDFVVPENDPLGTEVLLNSSETVLLIQQIMTAIGLEFENDKRVNHLSQNDLSFRFDQFLDLVDFPDNSNVIEYEESMHEAIDEMYQTYIKDIIKKGFLLRRGYLLPTFKEYWFVLQPCELSYYKNHSEKELCGTIPLDPKFMVKPSINTSGKPDKFLKFVLSSGERSFEFATHDHRTRMQWIAALQLAITYSSGKEGFQRDLISQRRKKREADRKRRKIEEKLRSVHLKEVELAKTQLKQEQLARQAAENQAKQFEELAREDSRRVAELEDLKTTLERLLEEETQAKRDEEIVRALQARVLAEEWEKREELEQLQREQKSMLEQERQKRMEFEQRQKEKENQLAEAQMMLKKLEEERIRLDLELKHARLKIIESEANKEDLEARMDAWQPILKQNSGVRRTLSFVVPSRERPTPMELRSSSFRRKTAQDSN